MLFGKPFWLSLDGFGHLFSCVLGKISGILAAGSLVMSVSYSANEGGAARQVVECQRACARQDQFVARLDYRADMRAAAHVLVHQQPGQRSSAASG